jgi:hypothetical protein
MDSKDLLAKIDQICRLAGAASAEASEVSLEDSDPCKATEAVYLRAADLRRLQQEEHGER